MRTNGAAQDDDSQTSRGLLDEEQLLKRRKPPRKQLSANWGIFQTATATAAAARYLAANYDNIFKYSLT
jgi:hypothetical protein